MYVSHLALVDYRSYREQVVEFPRSVIVLEGSNGRGKTNLVEALAYLSTFSSHRVSSSQALVRVAPEGRKQPGGAVIRARVQAEGHSTLLELEIARGRANRGRLNRANVPPRDLLGHLRTVVFAPEDLELLRGDPAVRRRFLDDIITKIRPHFLGIRQDFDRVLRQRAATLKQLGKSGMDLTPEADSLLDVWDRQLADLSATIVVHRQAVVDALQPLIQRAYDQLTEGDREATMTYQSHLSHHDGSSAGENDSDGSSKTDFSHDSTDILRVEEAETTSSLTQGIRVESGRIVGDAQDKIADLSTRYVNVLRQLRSQELRRGINLEGAHRDDLLISLDRLPVRGYASHGELWSSALMMRLAELELLRLDGDYPVLILDDVFAELDSARRRGLLTQIEAVQQVFITVAVGADVPEELHASHFRVFRDNEGFSRIEDEGTGSGD